MAVCVDQNADRIVSSIGAKCLALLAAGQPHHRPIQLQVAQRPCPCIRQLVEIKAENLESARQLILQCLDLLEVELNIRCLLRPEHHDAESPNQISRKTEDNAVRACVITGKHHVQLTETKMRSAKLDDLMVAREAQVHPLVDRSLQFLGLEFLGNQCGHHQRFCLCRGAAVAIDNRGKRLGALFHICILERHISVGQQ